MLNDDNNNYVNNVSFYKFPKFKEKSLHKLNMPLIFSVLLLNIDNLL